MFLHGQRGEFLQRRPRQRATLYRTGPTRPIDAIDF
jgi:hypothetical protein